MGEPTAAPESTRRNIVVAASVNLGEEDEILAAFQQAVLGVKSKAARIIMLSFARDAKVRDAVAAFLRDNQELLAA
jgi:hypothetical protein